MNMNTYEGLKNHSIWVMAVKIALGLVLIAYLVVLTRNEFTKHDYIGRTDNQIYTITISGQGEVTATPDIAQISLGVVTESKKVDDAQKENSEKMNSIISGLKGLNINAEDLKTLNYNIYPQYDYTDGRQILRGYEISQSVQVKIRDLEKISAVLELGTSQGANQIGSLNFTIDDPEDLKQEAREMALENATQKAQALAAVAGVKLGKLVSFNESSSGGYPEPYYADLALAQGIGGENLKVAPSVEPGSQDIIVDVNVTYEVL